ncbi:MAG: PAS domain S-box protein [Pseudomonadota bacterium]
MAALDRESRRLAALARYDILDTPVERAFDEVAELAAQICETPIAVVNLIGEGRQFFKAEVGLGVRETPLETSFCAKAILEEDFLIVPDATRDPRFNCNPLVTGEAGLRFYAGALLKTAEGLPIGTLCVLDTRPRDLTLLQQQALKVLGRQVMAQLELRLALKTRGESEARHSAIVESATDYAIIATDLDGRVTEWNTGAERILGWNVDEMLGQSAERFFTPEDRAAGVIDREMRNAVELGRGMDERWHLRKSGERFWASGEMMPLREEGDALIGYLKILRDRTDEKLRADQLAASEARLRASQKAGHIGTFEIDLTTGVMSVTPEFCAIFGVEERDCHPPETFESLILADDRHISSSDTSRIGGNAVTEVEYRIRRGDDDELRWIGRRAEFVHDAGGNPVRMVGTVHDITQRKRAERKVSALLDLGDRLRDANDIAEVITAASAILGETLRGARAGYALIDRVRGNFTVEHAWADAGIPTLVGTYGLDRFGATIAALGTGRILVIDEIDANDQLADDRAMYDAMDTRAQIMVPLIRRGELAGVLFVHSSEIRHWSDPEISFARNVADRTYATVARLQAEAEQAVLNLELSHRLKNTLAMVQAIAAQTLRNVDDREAVDALTSRIVALSTAHDILLQENWRAARLDQIAQGVLKLHADSDQVEISGRPIELSPRAGLSVSLLLNELSTNAAKYGALSVSGGRVTVSWTIEDTADEPLFVLHWVETGGPLVSEPTRKGFGSRLIRMGLVGTGHGEIDYAPSGLTANFSAPLPLLTQD